jgi:hypothetical protein
MRIKDRKLVALKKKLKLAGIKGLALDIDETLSFTIGYMIEELIKKLGNPENLTAHQIARKYRHTDEIPYWQNADAREIMNKIICSNKIQKELPLIENSNEIVQKINKIIPIVAYITVRPGTVLDGTRFWLKKHGFPKTEVITKPNNIPRRKGNEWKAKVLEYLYPQVTGIVDDNPGLTTFFGKKYKGTIYLYDNTETEREDINIVPCKDWKTVAKKIKEKRL